MNRLFVFAGLAILITALVFLNQGINKSGAADSKAAPPPPQAAAPAARPAPALVGLPAEETVGSPASAKHRVTVGWSYAGANRGNVGALEAPLQQLRSFAQGSGGAISLEVVNTDVPAVDRSAPARVVAADGVFVDGKPVIKGSLTAMPAQALVSAVAAVAR